MSSELPKLPLRQKVYSRICKLLARDEHEEVDVTGVTGLRLHLYSFFARRRYKLGNKLAAKHGTHVFRK